MGFNKRILFNLKRNIIRKIINGVMSVDFEAIINSESVFNF